MSLRAALSQSRDSVQCPFAPWVASKVVPLAVESIALLVAVVNLQVPLNGCVSFLAIPGMAVSPGMVRRTGGPVCEPRWPARLLFDLVVFF